MLDEVFDHLDVAVAGSNHHCGRIARKYLIGHTQIDVVAMLDEEFDRIEPAIGGRAPEGNAVVRVYTLLRLIEIHAAFAHSAAVP